VREIAILEDGPKMKITEIENNNVLSSEEICGIVKDYTSENIYSYALLLDGEWGCGKTHFVKHTILDQIKETDRKAIYISLYGISSVDMLHTTVFNAYYAEVNPSLDKAFKIVTALSPAMKITPYGIGDAVSVIGKFIGRTVRKKFIDLDKCFFIFDDLERCSAPICDVLGYINNFIEHNNCKVLIVANEAECGHISTHSNSEIRIIASALLKEHISTKESSQNENNRCPQDGQTKNRNVELADIIKQADELFGQSELYLSTKEKLIGKTIKYVPQLDDIVPGIISKILSENEDVLGIKDDVTKICIDAMHSEGVINLRILQYSLVFFVKIHDIVKSLNTDSDVRNDTLLIILNAILRVSVRTRVESLKHSWDIGWTKETAYANVDCLTENDRQKLKPLDYFNGTPELNFFSFQFIHKYVLTGTFDRDEVIKDVSTYIGSEVEKKNMAKDPYQKAHGGWWKLTEPELRDCMEQIENNFFGKKYSAHMCLKVIHLALQYSQEMECEIGHPDKLFAHLKKLVIEGTILIDLKYDGFLGFHFEGLNGDYQNRFTQYISELHDVVTAKENDALSEELNRFDDENWSLNLCNTVAERREGEFLARKVFLALFDVDTLLQKLGTATGNDYSNLLQMFRSVYNFSNLSDYFYADIPNLEKLTTGMKNINMEDRLIGYCRNFVLTFLEEKLKKIKNEPEPPPAMQA
jgi:hypothetical protein